METLERDLKSYLQQYFGFDKFKGEQEAIIRAVLNDQDVFVIMPTGGGKSLCYQLPAMIKEGTALVVSPLIALMKNQVDLIRNYAQEDSIAHFFNSSLTKGEKDRVKSEVLEGKTKLLYVAPESLVKEENIRFLQQVNISFIAIDEAHCISEWGHDFRPEYRNIRRIRDDINHNIHFVALTATATPKVQHDIVKNLGLKDESIFISSFDRPNLFYAIRPKISTTQAQNQIIRFVRDHEGKSGIIYVQNRKTAEELAEFLNINNVKAAPYHAGLDGKLRSTTQDAFLMEDIDVICATIAFGMGIDKPDIRFVIHYDLPKSIENYFQETGRAGRDGLQGDCLLLFSHKDVYKLEKLFRDKSLAERERNAQLVDEMVAYSESAVCRRKYILNYFGEFYDDSKCSEGCDNCQNPRPKADVSADLVKAIQVVAALKESVDIKYVVSFTRGVKTSDIQNFRHDKLELFGCGAQQDDTYWNSVFRNALLRGYLTKDIEQYGVLKITAGGREFINSPEKVEIPINHNFEEEGNDFMAARASQKSVLDDALLNILKDLRKKTAQKLNLPPYIVFQDFSLEEMATRYPVTLEEFTTITGVSKGKAMRYGEPFSNVIKKYVDENNIDRPEDIVVKTQVNKSGNKVNIIKSIDKLIPLDEIAEGLRLSREDLIHELETIVNAGTRLNIDYCISDVMDEELADEIFDYFRTAESDSIEAALDEFEGEDLQAEDVQLVRIKFISEMAN